MSFNLKTDYEKPTGRAKRNAIISPHLGTNLKLRKQVKRRAHGAHYATPPTIQFTGVGCGGGGRIGLFDL